MLAKSNMLVMMTNMPEPADRADMARGYNNTLVIGCTDVFVINALFVTTANVQ